MLEVAVGRPRARDVWRRLRFVIDQARAWSEAEHGGLRAYLTWAGRQGQETTRVAEAVLPETDTDALRILTVHAAKGLEFPVVILSGMSSRPGGLRGGVDVLWPAAGGCEFKLRKDIQTGDFDTAKPVDEQMDSLERVRLLYVACTRARDHLIVSLHRKSRQTEPDGDSSRTSADPTFIKLVRTAWLFDERRKVAETGGSGPGLVLNFHDRAPSELAGETCGTDQTRTCLKVRSWQQYLSLVR